MGIAEEVERRKLLASAKLRCTVGRAIQGMGQPDFEAIEYVIEASRQETENGVPQTKRLFSSSFIRNLLNDNGYKVGNTTVKDHLSRKCCCDD